jgi:hypothetical protein
VAAAAERERTERARAEPWRSFEWRQHTDGTGETRPWRVERQQQEFEIEDIAGAVPPGRAGNGADAFVAEDREQARDDGPAVRRPEP